MGGDRIDEIRQRRAALTPGEWRIIRYDRGGARIYVAGDRDGGAPGERRALVADVRHHEEPEAWHGVVVYYEGDREFFVAAPADVAYLLAENERLQSESDAARDALSTLLDRLEAETATVHLPRTPMELDAMTSDQLRLARVAEIVRAALERLEVGDE